MCDSRSVPKVFKSLRLLLLQYESHIQNQTFPFLFVFFHSETKDTFCFIQKRKTHPIPLLYLSCHLKWFSLSRKSIFFHSDSYLFVYFIDVRDCVEHPNYTLPIPYLSLWSERHSFSHSITSFSYIFVCLVFLIF